MRTGSVEGPFGVTSVAVEQIAQSSRSRVAIHFTVDTGVGYVTDLPGSAPGTGFPVTPGPGLLLTQEIYGDLVRHAFYGSSLSGTVNIGVIPIEESDSGRVGTT
jgi:hypothetical protein